ncbi:MAG: cobalt-precorrin-8X methylmutase [Pleurocapsa sp. SU_5_0]|nr:cobalt-precorrin-8X methylmutase [Pleurocapsa sp. SU_5_0]NJR45039.1 cobalt-precorrin-8X methylmutase [Hyellaceae cyanobacterium CSU_1_1]
MSKLNHPIVEQSFAIIDSEVGKHQLNPQEYALARRVIHATADFEYLNLLRFSSGAIAAGIRHLQQGIPIVTDVTMVKQGIASLVNKTFNNPIISAVEQAKRAEAGKTRTETGMLRCCSKYPQAIYLIGNAPTALLALCQEITDSTIKPALVIGVPVGFVAVIEAKQALIEQDVPYITIEGRKGGSPAAAAMLNALLILAAEMQ